MPALAAGTVLVLVVFAGMSGGSDPAQGNTGEVDVGALTVPATTMPQVVEATNEVANRTTLSGTLRRGSYGDEVKALQQRLHDLGFDPGPVDGQFGGGTQQAVWAFEGLVLQTPYTEQTGEVTDAVWQRMQDGLAFQPARPNGPGSRHMEIFLPLQAAAVYHSDKAVLLVHISSGDGKEWCDLVTRDTDQYGQPLEEPIVRDECGISKTPGGVFKFYRRYEGNRQGPLGGMWNPVYFNKGIAVHGAEQVPREPASHGCIRIAKWIADYFPSLVENGDKVWVWNGEKEPEEMTRKEMEPIWNYPNPNSTTTSSTTSTTTTIPRSTTTQPRPTTTLPKPTTPTTPSTPDSTP